MTDVFQSNGTSNFQTGEIELVINGQSKGKVNPGAQTLGQFVKAYAHSYGIRTFSVYLDGEKVDTEQASDVLAQSGATKLEIVAKDARG